MVANSIILVGRSHTKATEVSSRGECVEDIWVPNNSVATLSWRFLGGSVSASASSRISILLVWERSYVGWTMVLISPYENLCIVSSSLMYPSRSGLLAKLVGEFPADSTYSESPLFPPKLAADMASLSGSSDGLGDAI